MNNHILRRLNWIDKLIDKYNLDLFGLTVFTEFGTNDYMYPGAIAAIAGAEKVYAYNQNIEFDKSLTSKSLVSTYPFYYLNSKYNLRYVNSRDHVKEADIITNSGLVRPITSQDVSNMKNTAVIALMMNDDQVREGDIDIDACNRKWIELVATNEEQAGILDSMGFKLLKALFDAGLSVWNDKYLLLSIEPYSKYYENILDRNNVKYSRSTFENLSEYDAIIVANHCHKANNDFVWIGRENCDDKKSVISAERILEENPSIKIINISGTIDSYWINRSGINLYPAYSTKKGHSAINGSYLGYKVVFETIVASLKAAEQVARKRLTIGNDAGGQE